MSKTITVVEEYDKDGKLIKKTTTTTEGDTNYIPCPVYPYTPNTGDPWWQNPVTYITNSTTTIESGAEKWGVETTNVPNEYTDESGVTWRKTGTKI